MLTESERKEIGRIPFLGHKRRFRSKLTFVPIVIAFCAMSVVLCLLGVFMHKTLPASQLSQGEEIPPKPNQRISSSINDLPKTPMLFPMMDQR